MLTLNQAKMLLQSTNLPYGLKFVVVQDHAEWNWSQASGERMRISICQPHSPDTWKPGEKTQIHFNFHFPWPKDHDELLKWYMAGTMCLMGHEIFETVSEGGARILNPHPFENSDPQMGEMFALDLERQMDWIEFYASFMEVS